MTIQEKYNNKGPVSFEEAQAIWGDEQINTPGYDKIGLCNADHMNTRGFFWFTSMEEIHFFLINVWPVVLEYEDMEVEIWNTWNTTISSFLEGKPSHQSIVTFINAQLNADIFLEWIGTLKELETSLDELAVSTRELFHETDAPIAEGNAKEFQVFVKEGLN